MLALFLPCQCVGNKHTIVLGLGGNLCEELGKVGKVGRQELGLEDNVFARVLGCEVAS